MALDFIRTNDGTKIPALTRTDGANAVEVPESVGAFDDGSQVPVRVSAANPFPVTKGLTDAELRASPVPVSAASLPLPSGAATEATLGSIDGKVTACDTDDVTVQGRAASGAAVTGNPVLVGGSDGTNARSLLVDADGSPVGRPKTLILTGTGQTAGDVPIPVTDAKEYRGIVVQYEATSSVPNWVMEVSNDGTVWVPQHLVRLATSTPGVMQNTNAQSAPGIHVGNLSGRYVRVRVTNTGTGVLTVTLLLSSEVQPPLYTQQASTTYHQLSTEGGFAVNLSGPATLAMMAAHGPILSGSLRQQDNWRNNTYETVLSSAARTSTTNSADQTNLNARGVAVVIDVTAASGSPSVVFTVAAKDPLSGKYVTLLTSAAITGTGTTRLVVYPGVTVAANLAVSEPLPRVWRVTATHANGDSITYSVGASYTQ